LAKSKFNLVCHLSLQDFNKEVLAQISLSNIVLNTSEQLNIGNSEEFNICIELLNQHKLYYCDWSAFNTSGAKQFDLIISSETIYHNLSHEKLFYCIKRCLSRTNPEAVCLIAAKSYYFGVGGSMNHFKEIVDKDGELNWKSCYLHDSGIQREILALKFSKVSTGRSHS
jgi:hypothetical protein